MSKKQLLRAIVSAVGIVAAATAPAAPLPDGTTLPITPGSGAGFNVECLAGTSCFGMQTGALYFWTDINSLNIVDPDTGATIGVTLVPGKDPGIILGKDQLSGGQELAPSAGNTGAGDITGAWNFGGAWGTFYTAPGLLSVKDATGASVPPYDGTMTLGAKANLFDDSSCRYTALAGTAGSSTCPGKTELKVWNVAWNGNVIPMGMQYPCTLSACTLDLKAGYNVRTYTVTPSPAAGIGTWAMRYYAVVPFGGFANFGFRMALAGNIMPSPPPLVAGDVNISVVYGMTIPWTPSVTGGTPPITCRIGMLPSNGIAAIAANCASGTYMANIGFIGVDAFTYIPTDINGDGKAGTVTSAVDTPPPPTPTATTVISSPTPTTVIGPSPSTVFVTKIPTPTATTTMIVDYPTPTATTVIRSPTLTSEPKTPTPTTPIVTTPTPTNTPSGACVDQYPSKSVSITGKQGHLTVVVTGNITKVNTNGNEIKICPLTTASYQATTNTPGATVVCKVKNNTSKGKGHTKVNDHVKCSDKPVGNDKVHIKIKSGENKKWDGAKWV